MESNNEDGRIANRRGENPIVQSPLLLSGCGVPWDINLISPLEHIYKLFDSLDCNTYYAPFQLVIRW